VGLWARFSSRHVEYWSLYLRIIGILFFPSTGSRLNREGHLWGNPGGTSRQPIGSSPPISGPGAKMRTGLRYRGSSIPYLARCGSPDGKLRPPEAVNWTNRLSLPEKTGSVLLLGSKPYGSYGITSRRTSFDPVTISPYQKTACTI
jgi:hypothetical protein